MTVLVLAEHDNKTVKKATANAVTGQHPMQPPMICARSMPRWSSSPLPCAT